MRLIDADKFKDNILSGLYIFCQENKEDIARAIDDEPTIVTSLNLDNITEEDIKKFKIIWQRANSKGLLTVNCNDCDGYEAGYSAGLKDAERPQGEWLHECILDYRCSICNSFPLDRGDYPELSAYCPHCGAKMIIKEIDDASK